MTFVIVLLVILILIMVFPFVVFLTDYMTEKISELKRFHIGRFDSEELWIETVKNCAIKWLKKEPTVKKTDNYRYLLIDIIKGEYRNSTIQAWQKGELVCGLRQIGSNEINLMIDKWIESQLNDNGELKKTSQKIDCAYLGYAILKAGNDFRKVKPAMDRLIQVIESNLCGDEMVSYSQGKHSDARYVDTLGMVCPFLARYGVVYNEPKYVEMAVRQIKLFREHGMYRGTCLPVHAYSSKSGLPLGIYGWGRGTAWYLLGLLNTYFEVVDFESKANIEKLKYAIKESADYLFDYQRPDGGFNTIIQDSEGQYDSSATAAMAYFYKSCCFIFKETKYMTIYNDCMKRLRGFTMKNGAVDASQGDTHGLGSFSQSVDIMPFTQGLVLQAYFISEKDVVK